MARSFEHGVQIEAQTPVAISKGGGRDRRPQTMYEPTSTNRQRSMAWDSTAVDGLPDHTFRHGGGIRRAWMGIARYWQHSPVFAHLAASRLFLAPEPLLLTTLLVSRSAADIGRSAVAGLGFVCGTRALHASIGNTRIVCLRPTTRVIQATGHFIHSSVVGIRESRIRAG